MGKIDIDEYPVDTAKHAAAIKWAGLLLIVEKTKSVGAHLAHYGPNNQSATDMRSKLSEWAAQLRIKTTVEIFPKQERLMEGEPGSGINLPILGAIANNVATTLSMRMATNSQSRSGWIKSNGCRLAHRIPPASSTSKPQQKSSLTDGQRDNLNITSRS